MGRSYRRFSAQQGVRKPAEAWCHKLPTGFRRKAVQTSLSKNNSPPFVQEAEKKEMLLEPQGGDFFAGLNQFY